MDIKSLAQYQKNTVVREAVNALFIECANEIAIKDMDMGRDVAYVPKNKEVLKAMNKKLDSMFTEKKKQDVTKARSE